ncbi:MAG: DNA polymerase III epsilon subunit-like protein [Bradymonadia bacterium]|jgi:DNA polymerase III epsilon subunit-like protein
MKLSEALVLSFDTETTGADPRSDRIVELGGAYLRGTERLGAPLRALVNPGIYIPAGATNVHGIRNEDVADAPAWPVIAKKFHAHLTELRPVLTGYNLHGFDEPLLNGENVRNDIEWRLPRSLDTFTFALWGHRGLRSRKLSSMCAHYGVPLPEDQAHTADADSLACGWLLMGMIQIGLVPDDVEGAFERQAEIKQLLAVEQGRFGRYFYEDRETGVLRIGLGKHTGTPLAEVQKEYLTWLAGRPNLPDEARHLVNRKLGRVEQVSLF